MIDYISAWQCSMSSHMMVIFFVLQLKKVISFSVSVTLKPDAITYFFFFTIVTHKCGNLVFEVSHVH